MTTEKKLIPLKTSKPFRKGFKKKTPEMQKAIRNTLRKLREDPRRTGLHTSRIQGHPKAWEARIDRSNRITFHWEDGEIFLRKHCNHDVLKAP